jgi:hypothetical protein
MRKVATEKDTATTWTTYKCRRCKRMATDVQKTVPQFHGWPA